MHRLTEKQYLNMPWSHCKSYGYEKPSYDKLLELKNIPLSKRSTRWSQVYELSTFLDLCSRLPKGVILDCGAGTGVLSYLLSVLGWKVKACDKEATFFEPQEIPCVFSDLNKKLPYINNSFDVIVCKQVIEHLENPYNLIRECRRILRNGGHLVISTPNIVSINSRIGFLRTGVMAGFSKKWHEHRSIIHYEQLINMLQEQNFEIIEITAHVYKKTQFRSLKKWLFVSFLRLTRIFVKMQEDLLNGSSLIIQAKCKKNDRLPGEINQA